MTHLDPRTSVNSLYAPLSNFLITFHTPEGIGGIVHLFSDISGGQLNPAVSFGLFFARKLSLYRAAILSVAQIIGGLIGAGKTNVKQDRTSKYVVLLKLS